MTDDDGSGTRVEKPWGHELIWAHTDRYVGKILVIETGKRLSLQRHEIKDESILVSCRAGCACTSRTTTGVVRTRSSVPGDHRRVPTGRIHRYEAIERCELIEVSTPELDDVIRLEDDFGREGTNAPYGAGGRVATGRFPGVTRRSRRVYPVVTRPPSPVEVHDRTAAP